LTGTSISRSNSVKETKQDSSVHSASNTIIDGKQAPPASTLPPEAPKPITTVEKTITLQPSEWKPHTAPPSESGTSSPQRKVVTLPEPKRPCVAPISESADPPTTDRKEAPMPERKSSPPTSAKDTPTPSGGVPVVVETSATNKGTHKAKSRADGTGVVFAEERSTNMLSSKVEAADRQQSISAHTPALAEGAYVAPGVISYEEVPSSRVAAKRDDPFTSRLRERIDAICGGAGRNVEIQSTGEKRLKILVQASNREEAERLSRRILQLRELAQYEVSLDIKLIP
jgi:hypothetical protein